jgi:phenylacetate-CoA ligase
VRLLHAGLYRIIQAGRREPVLRILRELRESEWWTEERLRQEQLRKLRRVLQAAERAPHYRRVWKRVGVSAASVESLEDIARLPVLEKSDLRADPVAVRDPAYRGPVNVHVTTGSTGLPLRVYRSRLAGAYGRASQLRGRSWHGLRIGEREVRFGGMALETLGRTRAHLIDLVMNRVRLNPFDISDARMAEHLALIRRKKPRLLYGYPSSLALLAAVAERSGGARDLRLRAVMCSSERLYEHRRAVIARAFGCPVVDEYGAAEVSIVAMECPQGGLHQASESVYVEIVRDGAPLPAGDAGEVIVTDLNNLAAPLVRYRLGDRARIVPGPCVCGRGLSRMEILEGSSFGSIKLPDGRTLSGVALYFLAESLLMRPDAGLAEIFVVRRGSLFLALAVPRPEGDPSHHAELRSQLQEMLGPGAIVQVQVVDRIERAGGDKYRILVDETST